MSTTFKDRLGSVIMLVIIGIMWFQRDYMTPFGGIFPDRIMIIMAVLVLLSLILSFTPYRTKAIQEDNKENETPGSNWMDMAVVIGILLVWVLSLRYFGFALSSVICFTAISWYVSGQFKDWKMGAKALIIAISMTFILVSIFGYLLSVPLPRGEIFG